MAVLLKYQVGSCWSNVNPNEMAGGFIYFADIRDAALYALECGTGIKPMEVYVDLSWEDRSALKDHRGLQYKMVMKNWGQTEEVPVIRVRSVLQAIADPLWPRS